MTDGRIDGHFIINQDLSTSIKDELGLSADEFKQIGSVWQQVLDEANNLLNLKETSTQNQQNNTTFSAGTIVKLTKDSWNKIITLVNSALKSIGGREIKAEEADDFIDNMNIDKATINYFEKEYPNTESSTKLWAEADLAERKGNLILSESLRQQAYETEKRYNENLYLLPIKEQQKWIKQNKYADCGDRARIIQQYLKDNSITSNRIDITSNKRENKIPQSFEHEFIVIGLDENANINDLSTWGNNAVIIDAWDGKSFSVEDGIKRYQELWDFSADDIKTGSIQFRKL